MFEIKVKKDFAAAHNLRGYQGQCESLHGHNWHVQVSVLADEVNEIGIALDFTELKALLKKILEKLDHKYLNEIPPFDKQNPTSELLAKYIYQCVEENLKGGSIRVAKVDVWETEDNCASYFK